MRIERVDLKLVRLPLIHPFRTSSSIKDHLDHILIRVVVDGVVGWGECASPSDPYYCPETTETCWHILRDFLVPSVLGRDWQSIGELTGFYRLVKGNRFARAGLEMACWDALARLRDQSLGQLLGGTRTEIASGVSLGIESDLGRLYDRIDRHLEEGYRRIKLKIAPGWDVEIVGKVRERYPEILLQVDANSAYTPDDLPRLKALDAFDLLLIEQPLAHDDIIDHAKLQRELKTPICLDESIHSAEDARKAIELGACRIINIKVSRVGGLKEAVKIHNLCLERGIPVWCGGMHEFGVGRAANVAVASLAGFSLPGDVSGSDKYYHQDIVEPPILAVSGAVRVSDRPGLGVEPVEELIQRHTLRELTIQTKAMTTPAMSERDILGRFEANQAEMLDELRTWVVHETPSGDKEALDRLGGLLAERLASLGARIEIHERPDAGNHILARFGGAESLRPALVMCHFDTVWPAGTLERLPFRVEGERAYGPGIFDMKASLVLVTAAIEQLQRMGRSPERPIWVLLTSDEEVGSPSSRGLIESLAIEAAYVLVMEPGMADGSLKTARKGVARFDVLVEGKAAHAGVDPENGASAIVELAHQILKIQALTDLTVGTTTNVGVISGGTTTNVVPALALARVDARASTLAEAARLEAAMHSLEPIISGTRVITTGGFNRPPMERTTASRALYRQAREIGRELGLDLNEASTGGGSDGNFTAALGVPTLDGLGALGAGAHADHEHILIDTLSRRAALLAMLLLKLELD